MAELEQIRIDCEKKQAQLDQKCLCVKNLQANEKMFQFYTGFTVDQFNTCCEFLNLDDANKLRYWGSSSEKESPGDKRSPSRYLLLEDELLVEITITTGILNKDWTKGEVLMADRGFDIQDLLDKKGIKLNMPPFLRGKSQFDEEERDETRRIASCRIHLERAI